MGTQLLVRLGGNCDDLCVRTPIHDSFCIAKNAIKNQARQWVRAEAGRQRHFELKFHSINFV